MIKVRLSGTPDEIESTIGVMSMLFRVIGADKNYSNRDGYTVRRYVELEHRDFPENAAALRVALQMCDKYYGDCVKCPAHKDCENRPFKTCAEILVEFAEKVLDEVEQ